MALKNKYQREKQQYTNDSGRTWIDVSPANYRRGRLIEAGSEDCNTVEWKEVTGYWFCIGFNETQYRWVDSGNFECHIGDKYPIEQEEISRDSGSTWTPTGETRFGKIIRNSSDCPIAYNQEYLTIEILDTGNSDIATVYSNISGLEYRVNNGGWQAYNGGIVCQKGSKIQWKGNLTTTNNQRVFNVSDNATYQTFGNINSVYDYDTFTDNCYDYENFFYNSKNLLYADNLILPATTLAQAAYKCMFNGCTSLAKAPVLPATELAIDCYCEMFKGCAITTAPALPATKMYQGCCYAMFGNCKQLVNAPQLPATELAAGCYYSMFHSCWALQTAPSILPATTLYESCYQSMFQDCKNLLTAPELPATTLAEYCYKDMFWGCTLLVNIPSILPATELWPSCYAAMFQDCTSITTAPELPATTFKNPAIVAEVNNGLAMYAYTVMFDGCTKLNYIKAMFASIPDNHTLSNFTSGWVENVASSGTFVKNGGATWSEIGKDGVPSGWTVVYDGSLTRWVDSGSYICQGNDKYAIEKEQTTIDGGHTWTDTGETRTGSIIERDSQDCLYASSYFTITSLSNNNNIYWLNAGPSVAGYARGIYISTDNGQTWTNKLSQRNRISIATLNTGDKLLIRGTQTNYYASYRNYFDSDGEVELSGNIMSLLYGDDFADKTELTAINTFRGIFGGLKVVNAENLVLPATTLTTGCYMEMFSACASLITAPRLTAPILEPQCYYEMFNGCTSLTTAPTLPATTLASDCYGYMFYGCTNLVNAPELPATTLASYCYQYMFQGCTSLTTAPELPATTLANSCYYEMFYKCTKLNYIKCIATDISASDCLINWVYNVASTGTFVKAASMTSWTTGSSGIPTGWTVVTE